MICIQTTVKSFFYYYLWEITIVENRNDYLNHLCNIMKICSFLVYSIFCPIENFEIYLSAFCPFIIFSFDTLSVRYFVHSIFCTLDTFTFHPLTYYLWSYVRSFDKWHRFKSSQHNFGHIKWAKEDWNQEHIKPVDKIPMF